jgi:hypothetical protein
MTKKNAVKIILALLILFTTSAYGQTKKKKAERDTTKQWEIGLDLLWLIDKNQVPSTSLFARYNFVNYNNKKRAWRFRLGVDNSTYDSSQINDPRDNEIDIISPYLRTGYEWQKEISDKASFFYGVDMSTLYSQYKSKIVLYPGPNLYQVTDKTWEFGVIPFLGFKYRPAKWLAVSTESSLNFIYRIRREKDKVTDINFPNSSGGQGKIDINEFRVRLIPITVINLSFYLTTK